jgi:hypothetical protein
LDESSQAQSLDSGSITGATGASFGGGSDFYINNALHAQRGRADFDIRQQITADGTWDVPNNYSSAVVKNILGGWQFGGKWVGETGLPFTVVNGAGFAPICSGGAALVNNQCPAGTTIVGNSGGNYNADGFNTALPNVPSFGPHLSGQSKAKFLSGIFTASQFPAPALGQVGNLSRNTYDQPGYKDFDLTFEKYFSVPWFFSEKMKIEAKGEVFNRSNLYSVNSNMANSSFGQATNQLPPRSMQLHLRASF